MLTLRAHGQASNAYFSISAGSPPSLAISQGSSAAASVTVTSNGGYHGSVFVSTLGLPSGVTASFSPNFTYTPTNDRLSPHNGQGIVSLASGTATDTVTLSVSSSTLAGSYQLDVHVEAFAPNSPRPASVDTPFTLTVYPPAPAPFQITGINDGDTLSGDVVVNVSVLNGNLNGGPLSVAVDGTTVDAGDVQLQADGSYAEAMTVATNDSSNGVHTIAVSDGLGHSDTRSVTFSNVITNLVCDALFDLSSNAGGVPQSAHITASLAAPQAWQVAFQDYDGNAVRSYSGNGTSVDVTWDGKDSQGNIVSDASYDMVLTMGGLGSSVATANAAGTTVHRPVAKNSIGSSLILIDADPGAMIGGMTSGKAYAKFLTTLLAPKTGVDFTTRPSPILTTGADVTKFAYLRNRINAQLQIPCSLIYVYAHGSDVSKPRFSLGNWYWYSSLPLIADGVPSNQRIDVSALTAMAGYDNGNDPPLLAWIDTCQSAGINPLFADYSWANTFYSDQGGAFLGWTGNIGQYGAPQNSIYYCFTAWRNNFWIDLFQNGQNVQTSIAYANKTPGQVFKPDYNPKDIYTLYGTGSNSF